MKISKRDWQRYISQLSRVSAKSAARMEEYIGQHGLNDMEQVVRYAYALQERYGKAAASLACRMYDRIAEASGVTVPRAEPAPTADYGEVAAAIRGAARQAPSTVPSVVGRHTKRAAADTTLRNAQRDGAQFAWVPHGDTCPFCLTLAANGWQYMSKKALKNGHAAHIHSGCDCEYCVRFDKDTQVAGYDPDYYRGIYDAAEGDTWREKVNALRREQYDQNGEKIRAQKRVAYYERQRNRVLSDVRNEDLGYIKSEGYRMKFHGITGNAIVDDSIAHSARRILEHRAGTGFEDLVLLDADTGSVIYALDTGTTVNGVTYDSAINTAIERAHSRGRRIVAIHNHPGNLPPTLDDGVSMLIHGYDFGVVAAHDGTVYSFTQARTVLSEQDCRRIHNAISYQIQTGGQIDEIWYNMLSEYGMRIERR